MRNAIIICDGKIICPQTKDNTIKTINQAIDFMKKEGIMSADGWAICPKCSQIRQNKLSELRKAYDNLDLVWDELVKGITSHFDNRDRDMQTFKENYEIGVDDDGEFVVDYEGECDVCGFKFAYKYRQEVKV